jgi:hypothetical protein
MVERTRKRRYVRQKGVPAFTDERFDYNINFDTLSHVLHMDVDDVKLAFHTTEPPPIEGTYVYENRHGTRLYYRDAEALQALLAFVRLADIARRRNDSQTGGV